MAWSKSDLSIPGPLGAAPTNNATSTSLNPSYKLEVVLIFLNNGNEQSSSSALTPVKDYSAKGKSTKLRFTG